jgi:hypothetical protein
LKKLDCYSRTQAAVLVKGLEPEQGRPPEQLRRFPFVYALRAREGALLSVRRAALHGGPGFGRASIQQNMALPCW